jgi:glucokinase
MTVAGVAIAADLGGTKLAVGVVDTAGQVADYREEPVLQGKAGIQRLVELVGRMKDDWHEAVCVGVGATGLIEWSSGTIVWAPDSGYSGSPLRSVLLEATGLPAVIDTDVNMAAYGELRFGAGRGAVNMVVLTVGTGVGCALVLEGKVFRGARGFAGEGGHMTVNWNGPRCRCGGSGCLEAMCSGTALQEAVARVSGERQTGKAIVAAARSGDQQALMAVQEAGHWLGVGIASLVNLLDPERVVVGGSLAGAGELLFGPARRSLEQLVVGRQARLLPEILPARLGRRAGVIGAGALALAEHGLDAR